MKPENKRGSEPGKKGGETSRGAESAGVPPLDFHSAEFNRMDDLNDFSGNYHSFQSLDGVVTADMRHQRERRLPRTSPPGWPAPEWTPSPREEPERAEAGALETADSVTLISPGRTLIIDTDPERAAALGQSLTDRGLTCTLTVIKNSIAGSALPGTAGPGCLEAEGLAITGAFGGFTARVTVRGEQKILTAGPEDRQAIFDLVLDLQSRPSYEGDGRPLGYYAPGEDAAALAAALVELPEMRGRFKKPRFTSWQKKRCLHGRSAVRDCRRCLEVCPFGAIRSQAGMIAVDSALCQGCGGCVLVCPTGALRLQEPSPERLLTGLQRRLAGRSGSQDIPATLVLSDLEMADWSGPVGDENPKGPRIYFQVEPIALAGLELTLTALVYGAETVLVVCGSRNPSRIRQAVEEQVQTARIILQGLGLPEDKIRFIPGPAPGPDSEKKPPRPCEPDGPLPGVSGSPAALPLGADQRGRIRLAVQYLYDRSGTRAPAVPLPPGSPFGAVLVDKKACTLCLACVAACPAQALSAGGQGPQLKFREALCHQCGLCQATCPEGALRLLPRLLCDREAVEARVVLREDAPVRCVDCGQAIASPALIQRIQEKLQGHWMYAEERQLRRLQMCGPCRTRDTLMSEDLRLWKHH